MVAHCLDYTRSQYGGTACREGCSAGATAGSGGEVAVPCVLAVLAVRPLTALLAARMRWTRRHVYVAVV